MIVCDFCHRSQHEVGHIVLEPQNHAAICDDCVQTAIGVLSQGEKEEENKENSTKNT